MEKKDREFFRVEYASKKCELELFKGYMEAQVKDISAKSIGIIVEKEIPEKLFTNAYIVIELDKEREIDVELVKHKEIDPITHFYALKFLNLKESDQDKIIAHLLHEEILQKNIQKED